MENLIRKIINLFDIKSKYKIIKKLKKLFLHDIDIFFDILSSLQTVFKGIFFEILFFLIYSPTKFIFN